MILRLTFAARIALIMVTGLGMAWITAIALYYITRGHAAETLPSPAPDRVAALVELIERTPTAERPLVLRAANSEYFVAHIDAISEVETE